MNPFLADKALGSDQLLFMKFLTHRPIHRQLSDDAATVGTA
jgi:hypothetical protein